MIKVLHINTHINIGGIGQYIVTLTKALKGRGVECIVVSSGGDLEPELRENGIAHYYLDIRTKFFLSPKVLKAAFAVNKIIKKEKIGLIHAHTRVSQTIAFFASFMSGAPHISTCHGYFNVRQSRRLFDTWGSKIIAISDAVKRHLEKDFGINEKRIDLIYNGVDTERFSKTYSDEDTARTKKSLGLKDGPVIGTMGRLSPVKGQKFLIEAMKYVITEKKDVQCIIIGSGAEEEPLKSLAKSLGIEGSVNFAASAYTDIPLYLSCMDIFVLPSLQEGLGLAILEAMSAGKPCIGSNTGGINDIIKDGVNGLTTPVGDAKGIGDAVLRLLNDKNLRNKIGINGRDLVRQKFSLDMMADKISKLYKEVVNAK